MILSLVLFSEHEANDAFTCVRGRSATPWSREEKVLYTLLFVVLPQVSTCGKKEPVSNTLKPEVSRHRKKHVIHRCSAWYISRTSSPLRAVRSYALHLCIVSSLRGDTNPIRYARQHA